MGLTEAHGPGVRRATMLASAVFACLAWLLSAVPATAAPLGKIAFIRDGDVWIMKEDGSNQTKLPAAPAGNDLFWSPDGNKLVITSTSGAADASSVNNLDVYDLNARRSYRIHQGSDAEIRFCDWSPNSKQLIYLDRRRATAILVDLASGQEREFGSGISFKWSPDGKKMAFSNAGSLRERNLVTGEERDIVRKDFSQEPEYPTDAFNLLWSADSKRLFFSLSGPYDSSTFVYDSRSGSTVEIGAGALVAISPDKAYLLSNKRSSINTSYYGASVTDLRTGSVKFVSIVPAMKRVDHTSIEPQYASDASGWSADGQHILFENYWPNTDAPSETWLVSPDGSNPHKIADNASQPAWQPTPPDTTPILLVHGYQNKSDVWGGWVKTQDGPPLYKDEVNKYSLYAATEQNIFPEKYVPVYILDYSAQNKGHIPDVAKALPLAIQKIKEDSGAKKVVIVGHSMGGLLAREYMENLLPQQYRGDVAGLISLDTPNGGAIKVNTIEKMLLPITGAITGISGATLLEQYFGPAAQDMKPTSTVMADLTKASLPASPEKYGFVVGNYYPYFGDGLVSSFEQIPFMSNVPNLHKLTDYEITFVSAVHSAFVKRWGSKWLFGFEEAGAEGEAVPVLDRPETKNYVRKRYNELVK